MTHMRRYHYRYATPSGSGEFTVDELSESIANTEAKIEVARRVGNPAALIAFDLVFVGPAS